MNVILVFIEIQSFNHHSAFGSPLHGVFFNNLAASIWTASDVDEVLPRYGTFPLPLLRALHVPLVHGLFPVLSCLASSAASVRPETFLRRGCRLFSAISQNGDDNNMFWDSTLSRIS